MGCLVDDHEGGWGGLPNTVVRPQNPLASADLDVGGQAPRLRWQQDGEHGMWLRAGGRPTACGDARQQGCLGGAADPAPADEEGDQRARPVTANSNPQP